MIVTGAKKGNALERSKTAGLAESAKRGFWDHLVFTRIVGFGKDFRHVAGFWKSVRTGFTFCHLDLSRLHMQA